MATRWSPIDCSSRDELLPLHRYTLPNNNIQHQNDIIILWSSYAMHKVSGNGHHFIFTVETIRLCVVWKGTLRKGIPHCQVSIRFNRNKSFAWIGNITLSLFSYRDTSQSKQLSNVDRLVLSCLFPPSTQLISEQCSHNIFIFPTSIH